MNPLTIRLTTKDGWAVVALSGSLTESARHTFPEMLARTEQRFVIDLKHIDAINSSGLAEWIEVMSKLTPRARVVLDRLSIAAVSCMHVTTAFGEGAQIRSLHAPMQCPEGHRFAQLFEVDKLKQLGDAPATARCPQCGAEAGCEAEDYFSFLNS